MELPGSAKYAKFKALPVHLDVHCRLASVKSVLQPSLCAKKTSAHSMHAQHAGLAVKSSVRVSLSLTL